MEKVNGCYVVDESKNPTGPTILDKEPGAKQTIGELWESLLFAVQKGVTGNNHSDIYPVETRRCQITTIQTLVDKINSFHNTYN